MPDNVYDEITYPQRLHRWIWEWIDNFILHFKMDAITYPCWDLS